MNKFSLLRLYPVAAGLFFVLVGFMRPAVASALCDEGSCAPAISVIKYHGLDAWRLTDGKTEATVVPSLGRVMSFRRVDGQEWLWSALDEKTPPTNWGGWKNWGGDKTWLAPQSRWGEFGGTNNWPPAKEWDQLPFGAQGLSGGKVKIWSQVSPTSGIRLSRIFYFDETGDFVVEQTVHKLQGSTTEASIWNVAQVKGAEVDAVYLPRAVSSDYENGFLWMGKQNAQIAPTAVLPALLQVKTAAAEGTYKIGVDAPRAAIAATRGEWALVMQAPRPDGKYPDGAPGKSGTPAQLFGMNEGKLNYIELELLSPLLQFSAGTNTTHTMRWRIEKLPSADLDDPAVHAAVDKLLG